ncbi:hypothetical protein [Roseimaritima sediminicola]|uniref:hypothetical protein n=1 Tax=Roseimaritima sediminicola TaxID=2662066 RepID=UPI0012984BF3|nr:hypothetical protein [Roseimaritima sediminicola]
MTEPIELARDLIDHAAAADRSVIVTGCGRDIPANILRLLDAADLAEDGDFL